MQNPVEEEDRKWSRVSLRIASSTIDPMNIGKQLGLEATKTHLKGSLRVAGHKDVWRSSLWLLNSPLSDQSDIADHLRYFLDLLEPRERVLNHLTKDCEIDLFCGFSSGSGQGGFALDPPTLSRLAALRIPVVFDLYPPSVSPDTTDEE